MATLEEVSSYTPENVFKALEMTIFAKVAEDGDEEVTFVYDSSGVMVPEGYESLGLTTKGDGASWTRDTENSDTTSHGFAQPTRRDITSDVSGLTVTAQESKKIVMELFYGQEIVAQTSVEGNGIYWDKATRPSPRYVRLLGVAKDGAGDQAVYCARWLPRASMTEGAEQVWSDADASTYPLTFTGFYDSQSGTAFREMWGGPGFDASARGFDAGGTPGE